MIMGTTRSSETAEFVRYLQEQRTTTQADVDAQSHSNSERDYYTAAERSSYSQEV